MVGHCKITIEGQFLLGLLVPPKERPNQVAANEWCLRGLGAGTIRSLNG